MSLATLKHKIRSTNPRIQPVSGVGHAGFSLKGTLRNIGGVGTFKLQGGTTRTRFKGALPCGHGGLNGHYTVSICDSGACCVNDPTLIKTATKSTRAQLDMKYRWISGGTYPRVWVKDEGTRATPQSTYIARIKHKAGAFRFNTPASSCADCTATPIPAPPSRSSAACTNPAGIGASRFNGRRVRICTVTKWAGRAASQGDYIEQGGVAKQHSLPTSRYRKHFPMYMSGGSCMRVDYATWQEAQAAHALPDHYIEGDVYVPPPE